MRSLKACFIVILSLAGIAWQLNNSVRSESQTTRWATGNRGANADQEPPARDVLKLPLQNPYIIILKGRRELELYSAGALVRTYRVGLGLNPVADKKQEGDRATPEGEFYIFTKNPKSAYHLSLAISYPNTEDAERGLRDGLISQVEHDAIVRSIKKKKMPPQNTQLGGEIYIHGHGAKSDWTWGCVALENEDITELYKVVEVGTPVIIKQ